jgi:hypothetical protein
MILWGGGKALILAPKYGEDSYIYIVMRLLIYQITGGEGAVLFLLAEFLRSKYNVHSKGWGVLCNFSFTSTHHKSSS